MKNSVNCSFKYLICFGLLVSIGICRVFSQNPPKILADDIELVKLKDGVYLHTTYKEIKPWGRVGANGLALVFDSAAVLIDTPWDTTQTRILIDWIEKEWSVSVELAVVTHSHDDCAGGMDLLKSRKIPVYGHELTLGIMKKESRAVPDITFSESIQINIDNELISLYYPGPGHTIDNIVVWIPLYKVLFGGCLVKELRATGPGNAADAWMDEWPGSLRNLKERFPNAEIFIPGHGLPGGTELIEHSISVVSK